MALAEMMLAVLAESGLLALWQAVSPWLALDERQLIFVIATPVFLAVTAIEYLKIRHNPQLMDTREAIRNFTLGAGYQATELLFAGMIAFPVYALCYHYRLFQLELSWLTGCLTFLGVDFCFYWMHRASHRMRWFWAAHVVHHSSDPDYIDRNYGGTLIIWDRLFGTFIDEDPSVPIEYGITRPAPSNNLFVLWTHEYVDLFRDMARPGGLVSRLSHLWKPPEWERPAPPASGAQHARTKPKPDQPR